MKFRLLGLNRSKTANKYTSHLASSCTSSGITLTAITLSTLQLLKKVETMRGIFQEQVYAHLSH